MVSLTIMFHICFIHVSFTYGSFLSRVPCMNSINWPAPNVWVFIAQLVEHWSANAEAKGSNPVEAPKTFFVDVTNMLYSSEKFPTT